MRAKLFSPPAVIPTQLKQKNRLSGVACVLACLALAACGTELVTDPAADQGVEQSYAQLEGAFTNAQARYDTDPSLTNLEELGLAAQAFKTFVGAHEGVEERPIAPLFSRITSVASASAAALDVVANYPSTDVPKRIPPSGTRGVTTSTLTIGAAGAINDVDVRINLNHTFDGDLVISVRSPAGTNVLLSFARGGSGNNYRNTIFDDEAATPITSGFPPFAGRFRPQGLLSAFDGEDLNGTWVLTINDRLGGDIGTLFSWSLDIDSCDNDPPTVNLDVGKNTLWPPNHKMVKVATVSASDNQDGSVTPVVTVSSDEPEDGTGDGDTAPDTEVVDNGDGTFDVFVRAERAGGGDGRTYTITATATDSCDNVTTETAEVFVPHDKGKR